MQPVVQQQGEVVERDDRVELVAEHVKELADRPMRSERLRCAQQRVVAREMCRVAHRLFRHGSPPRRHLRPAGAPFVGLPAASGRPVRVLLISTQGLHSGRLFLSVSRGEDVRHPLGPTTCRDREVDGHREPAVDR